MARKNQGRSVIAVGKPKAALTPPLSAEFFVNTRSPGVAPITPVTGGSGAFTVPGPIDFHEPLAPLYASSP